MPPCLASLSFCFNQVCRLCSIPKVSETPPSLLVQVNVQPYAPYWYTMRCEEDRISEVVFSGTTVNESSLTIRSGALFLPNLLRSDWERDRGKRCCKKLRGGQRNLPFVQSWRHGNIHDLGKDSKHWDPMRRPLSLWLICQSESISKRWDMVTKASRRLTCRCKAPTRSQQVCKVAWPDGATSLQSVAAVPCVTVDSSVRE